MSDEADSTKSTGGRLKNLSTVVSEVIAAADHLTPLDQAAVRQLQLVAKKLESMYKDPEWDPKGDSYNHLFVKLLSELKLTPASRNVIVKPDTKEVDDDLDNFRKKRASG